MMISWTVKMGLWHKNVKLMFFMFFMLSVFRCMVLADMKVLSRSWIWNWYAWLWYFSFLQMCCWRFQLCEGWCRVIRRVVCAISKDSVAFFLDWLTLKMKKHQRHLAQQHCVTSRETGVYGGTVAMMWKAINFVLQLTVVCSDLKASCSRSVFAVTLTDTFLCTFHCMSCFRVFSYWYLRSSCSEFQVREFVPSVQKAVQHGSAREPWEHNTGCSEPFAGYTLQCSVHPVHTARSNEVTVILD